jgi:hypothetical protein
LLDRDLVDDLAWTLADEGDADVVALVDADVVALADESDP